MQQWGSTDKPQAQIVDPLISLRNELAQKRSRLADLSAKYTGMYPEVVRLRREVEDLERRLAEQQKSIPTVQAAGDPGRAPDAKLQEQAKTATPESTEVKRLRAQLSLAERDVELAKKEREALQANMDAFQARVERSPRREQEMISLTRDYVNLKRSYDDLLSKKLNADVAQNLEKRQKGEQFQILDPANLPEKPFVPDRIKVFAVAFFLALAVGIGGAVGLEGLDQTLKGTGEFRHFFDLPILASIPTLQDEKYVLRNTIRKAVVLGGIISFMIAVSVFLLMYGTRIRNILFSGWTL